MRSQLASSVKVRPLILELSSSHLVVREHSSPLLEKPLVHPSVKPIVKWAGGKQWLAVAAPYLVPPKWAGRYCEPFVGGGAFFFALEPGRAMLSDRNRELVATYQAIRRDPEGVIKVLSHYPYDEDFYYAMRDRMPRSPRTAAARFLYLNRTCWNGLYRVNREGKFNTPFGSFKSPTICDAGRIREAARLLRRAQLLVGDFASVASRATSGDFIYFDPPYITGHHRNGFLKYNAPLFSWGDQERLAKLAISLANTGVYVVVSNADQSTVVSLYRGFHYYRVVRRSLIAGKLSSRGVITEALLSSYPLLGCPSEVI